MFRSVCFVLSSCSFVVLVVTVFFFVRVRWVSSFLSWVRSIEFVCFFFLIVCSVVIKVRCRAVYSMIRVFYFLISDCTFWLSSFSMVLSSWSSSLCCEVIRFLFFLCCFVCRS